MNLETRKNVLKRADLYLVTCEDLSCGRTNLEVLERALQGGVKIVQLREKHWQKRDIYELAVEFRKRTSTYGALLIINDHVDIALASGADGVHLGQEDLPVQAARRIAPDLLIGASSHCLEEAVKAEGDGAHYVNIGPVFPTKTKENARHFLGPAIIREIAPELNIPFTVMGGINMSNIEEVVKAGARIVAMVTGITQAPDIAERVRELRKNMHY